MSLSHHFGLLGIVNAQFRHFTPVNDLLRLMKCYHCQKRGLRLAFSIKSLATTLKTARNSTLPLAHRHLRGSSGDCHLSAHLLYLRALLFQLGRERFNLLLLLRDRRF
jgi:hypothetical protein